MPDIQRLLSVGSRLLFHSGRGAEIFRPGPKTGLELDNFRLELLPGPNSSFWEAQCFLMPT